MLFSYRSGYSKIKFQSIDEKKVFATGFMIRGFFFVFSRSIFGFRGFGSSRRRDGSVLEGTICKQFVMSVKNRKNLKPCRGFKSFRSLVFRIQFVKKCVFGSSNPSTRRKIENGSMEIRKKLGAKKRRNLSKSPLFSFFLGRI